MPNKDLASRLSFIVFREEQVTETNQNADTGVKNGFFINQGAFTGNFTTPDGDVYDIRKLEPAT